MASTDERQLDQLDGASAVPRKNGELVFEAPWEGRAFGMAVAMSDRQLYAWGDFRDRLVREIALAEARRARSSYYERWLASLEALVLARGFVSPEELDARTAEYASGEREDDD
jgi:nitrile hydratase accessory protein